MQMRGRNKAQILELYVEAKFSQTSDFRNGVDGTLAEERTELDSKIAESMAGHHNYKHSEVKRHDWEHNQVSQRDAKRINAGLSQSTDRRRRSPADRRSNRQDLNGEC